MVKFSVYLNRRVFVMRRLTGVFAVYAWQKVHFLDLLLKVPSNMRRFRSSCACAKYNPGLCSPLMHFAVCNDSVSGLRRPWSDCADAQAYLGLRCLHMPEDTFSHGTAHVVTYFFFFFLHSQHVFNIFMIILQRRERFHVVPSINNNNIFL